MGANPDINDKKGFSPVLDAIGKINENNNAICGQGTISHMEYILIIVHQVKIETKYGKHILQISQMPQKKQY